MWESLWSTGRRQPVGNLVGYPGNIRTNLPGQHRANKKEKAIMNETNEKTPLTPEQVAAKNREVAMYYKIVCTLSRNLHCSPNRAMQLLELPGSIRKQISARIANETKKSS